MQSGVVIATVVEAQCYHDGFVAGLNAYAEMLGHPTDQRYNPDLRQLADEQSWRSIQLLERLSPTI